VNLQTVRYYERRGLLAEPHRSLGGHRLYGTDVVTILRVIKAIQRLDFTLQEVGNLLEAPPAPSPCRFGLQSPGAGSGKAGAGRGQDR
jgi:DNA-binding transcriptional MerR regulator